MTKDTMFLRPPAPECFDCGDEGIVRCYSSEDGAGACACLRRTGALAPEPASFCAAPDGADSDDLPF